MKKIIILTLAIISMYSCKKEDMISPIKTVIETTQDIQGTVVDVTYVKPAKYLGNYLYHFQFYIIVDFGNNIYYRYDYDETSNVTGYVIGQKYDAVTLTKGNTLNYSYSISDSSKADNKINILY